MIKFKRIYTYPVLAALALILSGCATAPYTASPKPQFAMPGVYHRVEKGQTLWSISKNYGIDLDDIIRVNHISDAASIEPGELIFIPSAQQKKYSISQSSSEEFSWPLKGRVIATYGQVFNDMVNKGINIQKIKTDEVTASRSGRVIFYGSNFENFGKTIIIDHGDGFSTVYAGNSAVLVKAGDYVRRGVVIAKVGSSGSRKGSYLHFEIRKGYVAQNPFFYLP